MHIALGSIPSELLSSKQQASSGFPSPSPHLPTEPLSSPVVRFLAGLLDTSVPSIGKRLLGGPAAPTCWQFGVTGQSSRGWRGRNFPIKQLSFTHFQGCQSRPGGVKAGQPGPQRPVLLALAPASPSLSALTLNPVCCLCPCLRGSALPLASASPC